MAERARPPDADAETATAVQAAVVRILLARGGDPAFAALEIHQAYAGRYELVPRRAPAERCTEHPSTQPDARGNCPTCGPKGI